MTISTELNLLIWGIVGLIFFGGFALYGYLHDHKKYPRRPFVGVARKFPRSRNPEMLPDLFGSFLDRIRRS